MKNKTHKQDSKNKKAQMKIQEMAFVLVAVVFLGGLLLLFFARWQMGAMEEAARELRELRTVTMLRTISSMPELSCASEALCIDQDKLEVFNKSTATQSHYSDLWQSSSIVNITVEEVYPKTTPVKKYTIYKKSTQENTVTYSTYVSLCSESLQKQSCKMAKIKITTIMP